MNSRYIFSKQKELLKFTKSKEYTYLLIKYTFKEKVNGANYLVHKLDVKKQFDSMTINDAYITVDKSSGFKPTFELIPIDKKTNVFKKKCFVRVDCSELEYYSDKKIKKFVILYNVKLKNKI